MKAIGNWVIVKRIEETHGVIKSKSNDKGKVISCSCKKSLNGKIVHFDGLREYASVGEYIVVPYDNIFCEVIA